ncbi:MAG TPA: DnaA/Hda family protein [Thermoanaerobaculia bacterium]|jgi:chromosomal replication initiator protein
MSIATFGSAPEHPHYTFDSFVVSECSRAAFDAAKAVASQPGRVHNPLVLCGESGSGKSHLLHAIAHAVRPGKVLRISGQSLVSRIHAAIRYQQDDELLCLLSTFDLLLLDEFPRRGRATVRYVLELLRQLRARGVQIVVTMPRHRWLLGSAAFTVAIGAPDLVARKQIARREAERKGIVLAEEALRAIAERSTGTANEVRCAVARLAAEQLFTPPPDRALPARA